MSIHELYLRLAAYSNRMQLENPASEIDLDLFERSQGIHLPQQFRELLRCFDGGELFVPGTTIYGVRWDHPVGLAYANRKAARNGLSIPADYLIIGRLNFGDLLCIATDGSDSVLQWDHERDEAFDEWNSLAQWLEEELAANTHTSEELPNGRA